MIPVQISTKHKLTIVPNHEAIRNLFPNAVKMDLNGVSRLLVPHKPIETFMLRQLGYDVPAPVLTSYDFPHPPGEDPFTAQKQTAALLTMNPRAYVLNDMGTGKTRAALWAWDYLRSNNIAGKLLVLAPLSTMRFTWEREAFTIFGEKRKIQVLYGDKKKRLIRLNDPDAEVFIINHDGLKVIHDELAKRPDIDTLIIDELAIYRNGGAARTKTLRKLVNPPTSISGATTPSMKMNWVWGLTGKPTPQSPTDVWGQASIVTPHTVPKYFGAFQKELMFKVDQFKWVPKNDATERAYAALQPAVRFKLDDVYELPETIHRAVDVEMGPKQAKAYKDLSDFCLAKVQTHEITAANAGAAMSKLLQISTGWVYTSEGKTVPLDNDERITALLDGINSTSRKVLVFVPFKHGLAGISSALTKEGIDHATVSGDTPEKERGDTFSLFQNTNKYQVIVAHPQCLAHGITLTAADTIIWFSPVTSLEIYEQANARISRVGQKHKQLILHLQGTPVEKRIYQMLRSKQKIQDKLLDLFADTTAHNPEK